MIKTKKAAIGAAMTWVVATIIILFVMIIFVYTSTALFGKSKIKDIFFVKDGQVSSSADSEQMLLALLQKEVGGKSIRIHFIEGNYDEIKEDFDLFLKEIYDIEVRINNENNQRVEFFGENLGVKEGIKRGHEEYVEEGRIKKIARVNLAKDKKIILLGAPK